ncbi:uncharacterized protein METZ01_LOCUS362118, partial [marine metagenome]
MADNPNTPIRRWSQRKTEARQAQTPGVSKKIEPSSETPSSDRDTPLDVSCLPSVEKLTADSDFTPFFQSGVPSALKKAALRKLWSSDPVLANVDGLNDYDEDFAKMGLGKVVQTVYQVGKGMIRPKQEPGSPDIPNSDTDAEQANDSPTTEKGDQKEGPEL